MEYEEYTIQVRPRYALINALQLTIQSTEINLDFYNKNHSLYKAKFTERLRKMLVTFIETY